MQNKQNNSQGQETKPLISFIITYHEQPVVMLQKCVESIIALSLRSFEREIIIVDDGSANSPLPDLERFTNDVVYLRKPNGGVSSARNFGLRTAVGEFVQFIDADDILLSSTYEHCLDLVRYNNVDAVLFDFTHEQQVSNTYDDTEPMSGSDLMRNNNIHGSVCCCLFKRSIMGNLAFTSGIDYGEDEEFTPLLLLRAENVVQTTALAYYYRRHDASAIANTSSDAIQKRLDDNHNVIVTLNRTADTLPAEERVALQRRVAQLTMDYVYNAIMLTHDRQQVDNRIAQLRSEGLFPLPKRNYTAKYNWFRRLSSTSFGMKVLMHVLPMMSKER